MQPHQPQGQYNPYAQPQQGAQSPYPAAPQAVQHQPGQHVPGQPYNPQQQQAWPQQGQQQASPHQGQQWGQQQQASPHQGQQQASPHQGQWGQQQQASPHQGQQWGQQQASPHQGQWGQQPQQQQASPHQGQQWGQQQPHNPYAPAAAAGMGQPQQMSYDDPEAPASEVSVAARAKFIERTYLHLALAITVFVVLSTVAQYVPGIEKLVGKMIGHRYSWGVVLALFCGAGYIADKWASGSSSKGMQYMGLLVYTLAEVIIFIPLIYIVKGYVGVQPIITAGVATLAAFAGLTAYVLISKKDFSFLKGTLTTVTMVAIGLVVASIVWGFHLGMVFSAAMIVLGVGYILYYTSNVMKHYRTDQYVAAALALFSAVAFVFWYVLRIILSLARQ